MVAPPSFAFPLQMIVLLIIVTVVFKSPFFKGFIGELVVKISAFFLLDKDKYTVIHNVTLPTEDGTTQIDHIVVSPYGIFVIETKNMAGWIFGGEHQATWTQKLFKHTSKFQNPLHQNYKHTKTLAGLLGLGQEKIFSLVVFVGDSTFKTPMPPNVTSGGQYVTFIKSKKEILLTSTEISRIVTAINGGKLANSFRTHVEHVQHVREIKEKKQTNSAKLCPKCGGEMILRTAKKGANAGNSFWGCSNYPRCKG